MKLIFKFINSSTEPNQEAQVSDDEDQSEIYLTVTTRKLNTTSLNPPFHSLLPTDPGLFLPVVLLRSLDYLLLTRDERSVVDGDGNRFTVFICSSFFE